MKKTLHLRRHSIKDGANNTIGTKGLELAINQGKTVYLGFTPDVKSTEAGHKIRYAKLFHGPLVRTAQTALAFCKGLGYIPTPMPVVDGLGSDALSAEMSTEAFRNALKSGLPYFRAALNAHGVSKAKGWAEDCYKAVASMFACMEDKECAVGFFHSPTIELAAWLSGAADSGVTDWDQLRDLEGLIFTCDDAGQIRVTGKVSINQA